MSELRDELVDVHAHFLTDEYVSAARSAGHISPDGMGDWPSWSVEEQLASMNRRAIRQAILSISSPGMDLGDAATAQTIAAMSTTPPPASSTTILNASVSLLRCRYPMSMPLSLSCAGPWTPLEPSE